MLLRIQAFFKHKFLCFLEHLSRAQPFVQQFVKSWYNKTNLQESLILLMEEILHHLGCMKPYK